MDSATPVAALRGERPLPRLSQLGDELLARYVARGSQRAFAVLYQRYHQQLYRYCRSILRDDPDAQDALQSAFTRALAALRRDQRNAPLRPWLYRIAHNEAISLLRRRGRDGAPELLAEHLAVASSAEQEVAGRIRWRTLVDDLSRLPERQRSALLLRELSGLSHEEIGIALGTSTAAAKQAIFEARQALAEIEEGRAMGCEELRGRISDGDLRVLRGRRVRAHLRECSACQAFAAAIPERRTQLRALTPALPPAAAAALLSRSLHAAQGGVGAGGSSVATTAVAGKAATAVAWKAVAGIVLLAGTAAGVSGIRHAVASPARAARSASAAPARRGDGHVTQRAAARHSRSAGSSVTLTARKSVGAHRYAPSARPARAGRAARAASRTSEHGHAPLAPAATSTGGYASQPRGSAGAGSGSAGHRQAGQAPAAAPGSQSDRAHGSGSAGQSTLSTARRGLGPGSSTGRTVRVTQRAGRSSAAGAGASAGVNRAQPQGRSLIAATQKPSS